MSPQAMEGIDAVPESELFIASDANQFIDRIIQISKKNKLTNNIGQAARLRVLQDYNWTENLARVDSLFASNAGKETDQMTS